MKYTNFNGKYEKEILYRESRFIAYLNYYMSVQSGDECDGIIKFM